MSVNGRSLASYRHHWAAIARKREPDEAILSISPPRKRTSRRRRLPAHACLMTAGARRMTAVDELGPARHRLTPSRFGSRPPENRNEPRELGAAPGTSISGTRPLRAPPLFCGLNLQGRPPRRSRPGARGVTPSSATSAPSRKTSQGACCAGDARVASSRSRTPYRESSWAATRSASSSVYRKLTIFHGGVFVDGRARRRGGRGTTRSASCFSRRRGTWSVRASPCRSGGTSVTMRTPRGAGYAM
jgi:hypothetical protein